MSLLSRAGLLSRIRRSKEARARLVASNLDKGIAFQIHATRDKRDWSQAELAAAAGMGQNNVSRLESPDYGRYTISSLKRIAQALDVALVVRFVPYSQYIDWLSGTPFPDFGLRPESLAVPSFEDESGTIDRTGYTQTYYCVTAQPVNGVTAPPAILPLGKMLSFRPPSTTQIMSHSLQENIVFSPTTTPPAGQGVEKVAS
jgi:transcriptional regulator with XRE-family HTH domain